MAGLYQRRFIVVEHFRSHFSNLFLYSCHRRQRQSVSRDFQWPCCYERRYPYGKCESFRTYCHAFRQYDMRRTRSRCCLEHQSGNFRYDIFMAGSNIIWCHRRYVGQQPDESQSDPDKQQHGCRYRSIYHIGNHSCRLYECLDYGSHHHGESESCGYGYSFLAGFLRIVGYYEHRSDQFPSGYQLHLGRLSGGWCDRFICLCIRLRN